MSDTHHSEIAAFRERQALEEESARLALNGFASTASHQMITARMQLGAERILCLINEGKHDEAEVLMNMDYWSAEVESKNGEKVIQRKNEEKEPEGIESDATA